MAIKPIGFYGKFRGPGVDTSAAQRMKALAGLGETVQDIAVGYGKTKREQEAVVEGEAAGIKALQEGTDIERKNPYKFGGPQHNRAADMSYSSAMASLVTDMANDALSENPDDIEGFTNSMSAKFNGVSQTIPENLKPKLNLVYSQLFSDGARKVNAAQQQKISAQETANFLSGAESLTQMITTAHRNGEQDQAALLQNELDQLSAEAVEVGTLSPIEYEKKRTALQDEIAIQSELGLIDRTLLDEGLSEEERIKNGRAFVQALREKDIATLSPRQKDALIQSVTAKVAGLESSYKEKKSALTVEQIARKSDVFQSIKRGSVNPEEANDLIRGLLNDGLITSSSELDKYRNQLYETSSAAMRKTDGIANVAAMRDPERDPVTVDPVTQNDADNYYEIEQPFLSDDPLTRSAQQSSLVSEIKFIPKQMKQEFRNDLLSGEPTKTIAAANTMFNITQVPGMRDEFTDSELAFADTLNNLIDNIPPEEALKMANEIANPISPGRKAMVEARTAEIKSTEGKKVFANTYEKELAEQYDPGFWSTFKENDISKDRLIADYGNLVESYYKSGFSSVESAKERAMEVIKSSWKPGEFGFMQNRPEEFSDLQIDGDVAWIRDAVFDALSGEYAEGSFSKDDIILESDSETAMTAKTGKPTYNVMVRLSDGTLSSPYFVEDGMQKTRFNPAESREQYKQAHDERIKSETEAQMNIRKLKASIDTQALLGGYGMTKEQKSRAGKILRESKSPFAVVTRAIGDVDKMPKALLNALVVKGAKPHYALDEPLETPDIAQWHDEYIERLRLAGQKGK